MATQYSIPPQAQGVNGFATLFCDTNYTSKLAATTAITVTVPSFAAMGLPTANEYNKFLAVFSYEAGAVVWVANNATAAVPAGATFAASTSQLNPACKQVKAGDVISMISPGTPNVSVSFFAILD